MRVVWVMAAAMAAGVEVRPAAVVGAVGGSVAAAAVPLALAQVAKAARWVAQAVASQGRSIRQYCCRRGARHRQRAGAGTAQKRDWCVSCT